MQLRTKFLFSVGLLAVLASGFAVRQFVVLAFGQSTEVIFQDNFERPNSPILGSAQVGGTWIEGNELFSSVTGPSGQTHYPAYFELLNGAMTLRYPTPIFGHHASVYAYASTTKGALNPTLTFTYTPTVSGRIAHSIGLMTSAQGFLYNSNLTAQEYLRYTPVKGIGLFIGRSGVGYNNSHVLLIKYDGPEARFASMPNEIFLPFQFDAGVTYTFSLKIADDTCGVEISNGVQTEMFSIPLQGFSVFADQVFITDEQDGDDGLRFDNFMVTTVTESDMLEVELDIHPGTLQNPINLNSNGVVPVALLSSASFDATQADPASIVLAGAHVRSIGKGKQYACSNRDVNADSRLDLVCNFETAQFDLRVGDATAELRGSTFFGQDIHGSDFVRIVR